MNRHSPVTIRRVTDPAEKRAVCERILRDLPDWFGIEEAIRDYIEDSADMTFLAAERDGEALGFAALNDHGGCALEIHVMGVRRAFHRQGIGRHLVDAAAAEARALGRRLLTVKTLSPRHPSPEYAATRSFYRAMGFQAVEEFPTLWGEHNPCLLMAKILPGKCSEPGT
ncbi:MAG TPA: GNAT family N-acetyltransferase [Bacillota bacterium]